MILVFRGLKRAPHLKNPQKFKIYSISTQEKTGRNFGVGFCLKGTFLTFFKKKYMFFGIFKICFWAHF